MLCSVNGNLNLSIAFEVYDNMKNYLFIFAFLFSQIVLAQVDFIMIPPKTIEPGQNAIMILPVRILDQKCSYKITKTPSANYTVEGPDLLQPTGQQEIQYLPFNVFIPAFAAPGSIFFLKLTLTPLSGCVSQQTYEKELSVKIGSRANVAIDASAEQIQLNSPAGKFDFVVRNSGNTNLNLSLTIENFTPNVRIQVSPNQLALGPQERKTAIVLIDFSGSGADFASFKVVARNGGQNFLSKNFQVRLLRGGSVSSTVRTLQTSLYLTHDFFSEGGRSNQSSGLGGSINGDLSDFYSLSAYMQQFYLQDDQFNQYELNLNNIDGHQFTLASSLNPTGAAQISAQQLRGIRYRHSILKDVAIGFFAGSSQNGDQHYGAFSEWVRGYNKRWMVYTDINSTKGDIGGGISGQEHYQISESLAFAPSMTLTEDELRGTYKNFSAAFTTLIHKKAPLQVRIVNESDKRYSQNGVQANVDIPVQKILISLGGQYNDIQKQNSEVKDVTAGEYKEASFKVYFPFFYQSNSQVLVRYQTRPAFTGGPDEKIISPEVYLTKSTDKWLFWSRIGRQAVNGYIDPALTSGQLLIPSSGAENYAQFYAQYKVNSNTSVVYTANQNKRDQTQQAIVQNKVGVIRESDKNRHAGYVTHTQEKSLGQKNNITGLEYQFEKKLSPTLAYQISARVEKSHDLGRTDYGVYNQMRWTPGAKVPAKVEKFFGGKNSGNIMGKVCYDMNNNRICDMGDTPVADNVVRLGSVDIATDDQGQYKFENTAPGPYLLSLDSSKIPFAVNPMDLEYEVNVRRNDVIKIDFALRWTGQIKVIVFDDRNGDRIWQPESEIQLPDFSVVVQESSGKILNQGMTSSSGFLTFAGINQGQYIVKILNSVQGFKPGQSEGISLKIPDLSNNGLVQLAADFDADDSLIDQVLVDVVDKVVFSPDYTAEILVNDPSLTVSRVEIRCQNHQVFTSIYKKDDRKVNLTIKSSLKDCRAFAQNGVTKVAVKLFDDQNNESLRFFEIIFE